MQVVKSYPDNMFCWVDLATTDVAAAKEFYSGLFGWSYFDMPTPLGYHYSLCQIDGYNVAGMSILPQEMMEQGIPPIWSSYIKHDDVDSVVAKAVAAGGTEAMPAMDVMESGRMAVIQDPTGAMVGVWQPRQHIGAQLVNMPNALVWNELQTKDVDTARSFYGEVFGWGHDSDPNGYDLFKLGRADAGRDAEDGRFLGGRSAQLGTLLHVGGYRGDGGQGEGVGRRHSCSADPYGHGRSIRGDRGPAGRGLHVDAV